jgi:hypothetical protein
MIIVKLGDVKFLYVITHNPILTSSVFVCWFAFSLSSSSRSFSGYIIECKSLSSGYQVEKRPVRGKGDWTPVNATPTHDTHFKVPNLVEDAELEFRVVAVNDAGSGKPSKSTGPHRVRDPICKSK